MRAVILLGAFLRRDWAVARSYRFAFLFSIGSMLVAVTLYYYLGRLIDQSTLAKRAGLNSGYFAFAIVGLSLFQIVQTGVSSFAQKIRQEQTTGTFEALMATPAPPSLLVLSNAAYDLLRATMLGITMIVLAVVIFGFHPHWSATSLLVALAALAGCIVIFAALGVAMAGLAVVVKQIGPLLTVVLTAFALLGGVYYPVSILPAPLEWLGKVLPFTWGLDVLRKALLVGQTDGKRLVLLLASGAIALPASLLIFRLGLRYARRAGTLAQY